MFHKISTVKPMDDMRLFVNFQNGDTRIYDVTPLLDEWQAFKSLKSIPGLFEQVQVDQGGFGISWNDDIDLACDELYYGGSPTNA